MGALFQIALNNALAAALLAPLAWAISRIRRPELTVAIWLLVLLKLITPPLWTLHIPVERPAQVEARAVAIAPNPAHVSSLPISTIPFNGESSVTRNFPDDSRIATAPIARTISVLPARKWFEYLPIALTYGWITGTMICLLKLVLAAARLRRLANVSQRVDLDLSRRIRELASLFGLRSVPPLRLVDLPVAPMLCIAALRPFVVLPTSLWRQLTAAEQDAVLAHELAHLARRDHWLRAFELLVCSLYWWHPVVWLARRELREASEQSCDALVLRTLPGCARSYASALVEAVDFISTFRAPQPALACGMGQFTNLKRRLVMITQETNRGSLSRPMFAALCLAGAMVLPLSASFAAPPADTPPGEQPKGAASTPDVAQSDPKPAPAPRSIPVSGEELKVFHLHYASAANAAKALDLVFPKAAPDAAGEQNSRGKVTVAIDARTNSVLISGKHASLVTALKLLEVLEDTASGRDRVAGDRTANVPAGSALPPQPGRQSGPGDLAPAKVPSERGRRTAGRQDMLQDRLEHLEKQAHDILDQIQQIKQEMGTPRTPGNQ